MLISALVLFDSVVFLDLESATDNNFKKCQPSYRGSFLIRIDKVLAKEILIYQDAKVLKGISVLYFQTFGFQPKEKSVEIFNLYF